MTAAAALVPIPGDIVRHAERVPGPKTPLYLVTGEYTGGVDLQALRPDGPRGWQNSGPASVRDVAVAHTNWALRLFRCLIVIAAAVAESARRDREHRLVVLALRLPGVPDDQHSSDEDCAPFLEDDGTCGRCGVSHGPACERCGGCGYHATSCAEVAS